MGNNELAITSFEESISFAKRINAKSLQAFAQKGLAQINTIQGNYEKAIFLLNEAYTISFGVNDLVLNQEIFKELSENYLALNNWGKYREFHSKYINTQSKLIVSERKSISNLLDEKGKTTDSKINSKFPNFWVILLLIINILIILFTFISVKKMNKQIETKKIKIDHLQSENIQ